MVRRSRAAPSIARGDSRGDPTGAHSAALHFPSGPRIISERRNAYELPIPLNHTSAEGMPSQANTCIRDLGVISRVDTVNWRECYDSARVAEARQYGRTGWHSSCPLKGHAVTRHCSRNERARHPRPRPNLLGPKLPGTKFGRKLDATTTTRLTLPADCVSESLDTLDERWRPARSVT